LHHWVRAAGTGVGQFGPIHGVGNLTKLHTSTVRLDDPQALKQFLADIPYHDGLAELLATRLPQNTRGYDDENQIARFVISDGDVVSCFTVPEITIDQAEMITLACEEANAWNETAFQQAVDRVLGASYG
jgi:hypothetical protein